MGGIGDQLLQSKRDGTRRPSLRRAYELRDRVGERERFYIDGRYQEYVTGDLEAARKVYELWIQTYPRLIPFNSLGFIDQVLGQHDKTLPLFQRVLQLDPDSGLAYSDLVAAYEVLNRLDEAKAIAQQAQARKLVTPYLHVYLYQIDFLQHDLAGMEQESAALTGKPGYEDAVLFYGSGVAAYIGQFIKSRNLTARAVESALGTDEKEVAAGYESEDALQEVVVGNRDRAREQAQAALSLSKARDTEGISILALALVGDSARTALLVDDLEKRFPSDTIVNSEYMPAIRAAGILAKGNGSKDAERALEALAAAEPYEMGTPVNLYPAYLRGEAYLAAHQGSAAAVEFQKILDHRGLILGDPIVPLAHLGLGRAYALEAGVGSGLAPAPSPTRRASGHPQGAPLQNTGAGMPQDPNALVKARIAYQDFLALWKDADPDIPILKQAKAEYAKLH